MKILFRLSLLVLIPITVGLALILSGNSIGSYILAFGTPAVMIILVIVGLIMMLKGKLFQESSKDVVSENIEQSEAVQEQDPATAVNELKNNESNNAVPSEKEREHAAINAINDTDYYTSKFNLAEYEAKHVIEGTKNASKKGCALVIILVISVIADVVLATVFTIKQIWVGAIVCAVIFAVLIITGLITAAIREALSMHGDIRKAKKMIRGKVKSCIMSSSVRHSKISNPAVRISDIVYRVVVCADDNEYEAFSKQFYETDETVVIAVMCKKRAKIVEESDLENQSDELKSQYEDCLTTGKTVTIEHAQTNTSHVSAGRTHSHSHRRH